MFTIEIFYNRDVSVFDAVEVSIDKQICDHTISKDKISITQTLPQGIHKLRLTAYSDNECLLKITNVKINGDDIKHTIYLSYIEDQGKKIQPTTEIWKSGLTWTLPFGNPLSMWFVLTSKKFENGLYGSNLYERFVIYYPESVQVEDNHPNVVKDYFKYDFDFTVINKSDLDITNIPFQYVDIGMSDVDFENCKNEILENIDKLSDIQQYWHTDRKNQTDTAYDPKVWIRFPVIEMGEYTEVSEFLIQTRKLLESLDINNIEYAGIAMTKSKGAIKPHVDDKIVDDTYRSLANYINLQFGITVNPGAKMKLAGIGLIPLDDGAFILNNGIYNHSLVNDNDSLRIRMLLKFKTENNLHLYNPDRILNN